MLVDGKIDTLATISVRLTPVMTKVDVMTVDVTKASAMKVDVTKVGVMKVDVTKVDVTKAGVVEVVGLKVATSNHLTITAATGARITTHHKTNKKYVHVPTIRHKTFVHLLTHAPFRRIISNIHKSMVSMP